MVGQITHTIVVGEDGGHSILNGSIENSAIGLERDMKTKRRSGYIARVVPDDAGGVKLEMIQALNNPQTPFETVEKNFLGRQKTHTSSNPLFARWGHKRSGRL